MLVIRRVPGIIFTHKLKCSIFLLLSVACFITLYSWRIICTNLESWDRVTTLCSQYKKGKISGDLCPKLCGEGSVVSLACQTFHSGKDTIFSATLNDGLNIVVKSSQNYEPQDIFYWIDDAGEHYPTDDFFRSLVENRIQARLNITLTEHDLERIIRYPTGQHFPVNSKARRIEMKEIWRLLQDNEYLISIVYAGRDMFPKIMGICGHYFGTEYLKPAMDGDLVKIVSKETEDNWANRVHLAVMILDLVEQIDGDNLVLCDIKPNHFGISDEGKLKILDLDVTFPRAIANAITKSGKNCDFDSDCHLFDCHSVCNKQKKICDAPVTNSNLQIVCEKILLGWAMPGVMVPGLLMTSSTPSGLASLLRQCAHGAGGPEFDSDIATRLTHTLAEMDAHLQNLI